MDCNMPFCDGYQATQRIREICTEKQLPQPQIVAVTGHGEEEYVERCRRAGMDQVIVKPARPAPVLDSLEKTAYKHDRECDIHDFDIGQIDMTLFERLEKAFREVH